MDLDQAIAELEVTPPLEPDAVRRAYLRKLKTRKPEVDPEGFRKLRDAYEFLRQRQAIEAVIAAHKAASEETPAEPEPAQPTPAVVEIIDTPQDPTAKKKIAQLVYIDLIDEAGDVARDRLDFAIAHPGAAVVIEGLAILELILRLHEAGNSRRARGITRKMKRWFEVTGAEARVLTPQAAALFALERDLAELPGDFSEDLIKGFARAIREGKREHAARAIARYRTREGADALEAVRLTLVEHAPTLHNTYADLVPPPRQFSSPKKTAVPWYLVFVILGPMLKFCGGGSSSSSDVPGPPEHVVRGLPNVPMASPTATPLYNLEGPASALSKAAKDAEAVEVVTATESLLAAVPRGSCSDAIASFRKIAASVTALGPLRKGSLLAPLDMLRNAVSSACGVSPSSLP